MEVIWRRGAPIFEKQFLLVRNPSVYSSNHTPSSPEKIFIIEVTHHKSSRATN